MTRRCKIPDCRTTEPNPLFQLPGDPTARQTWLLAISTAYPKLKLRKTVNLCEKHFKSSDFTNCLTDRNGKIIQHDSAIKVKRLRRGAVPHFLDPRPHGVLLTPNVSSINSQLLAILHMQAESLQSIRGPSSLASSSKVPKTDAQMFSLCSVLPSNSRRKMAPAQDTSNWFQYPPKPPVLHPQNIVSEKLLPSRLPFMQIRRMQREQVLMCDSAIVNAPFDNSWIVQILRRLPSRSDDDRTFSRNIKRYCIHKDVQLRGWMRKSVVKPWLRLLVHTSLYRHYRQQRRRLHAKRLR